MTGVDVPDRTVWSSTGGPSFTVDAAGQMRWAESPVEAMTDHETRRSPHGDVFTLHQVWNADRSRLLRIVIEGQWVDGPCVFAEARRPRGGWRGDELGRLMLGVLSFGVVGR